MKYTKFNCLIFIICAQVSVHLAIGPYYEIVISENRTQGSEILHIQTVPPNNLKITCLGYDSLQHFQIDEQFENFIPYFELNIQLDNCFNNATDHTNYQEFSLANMIEKLPIDLSNVNGIQITNNYYGLVGPKIFIQDFDFIKYRNLVLNNIGYTNTVYLQEVRSLFFTIKNGGQINFNDFVINSIISVDLFETNISNFTKDNLAKFPNITCIIFTNFQLDNYNAFNIPNLFEQNIKLELIKLESSPEPIILNENIFMGGLHSVHKICLNSLKLATISKNIFHDLPKLSWVELKNNYIKVLETDVFANNFNLGELHIGAEIFLYSEGIQQLELSSKTLVTFNNANIKDLRMLTSIIQNSNLEHIEFDSKSSMWIVDLFELLQNGNRSTRLDIAMIDIPFRVNFSQLQDYEIFSALSAERYKKLNFKIEIIIGSPSYKTLLCIFDPEMFLLYSDDKEHLSKFYIAEYNAEIILRVYGFNLVAEFKILFIENCPKMCKCYHNPLLDDISIDCTNQGLKSIPILPYPTQFITIDTIEMNLGNNLLADVRFDSQDEQVLKKLTLVRFNDNPISRVKLAQNVEHLNFITYCVKKNSLLRNSQISFSSDSKNSTLTNNFCAIGVLDQKNATQYLRARPIEQIKSIWKSISLNVTCANNL